MRLPPTFSEWKPLGSAFALKIKSFSILLFTSLLAIPLARQSCLDATLFTGFEVIGVTLDFLDNVLLLYLPLEPAQRILERFAFLHTNLSQRITPPNPPEWLQSSYLSSGVKATANVKTCSDFTGKMYPLAGVTLR
jgi:hypothetical protein